VVCPVLYISVRDEVRMICREKIARNIRFGEFLISWKHSVHHVPGIVSERNLELNLLGPICSCGFWPVVVH
jgi:hypothetical protein